MSCVTKRTVFRTDSCRRRNSSCSRARYRVEGAEGLVHEQHLGVTGERPRDPDALALTARKLSGIALAVLRRVESHQVEELVDALTDPLLRPAEQLRHDGRVPGHRHVREEADLLDHVADVAAKLRRVERSHAGVVEQDVALVDVDEPVHHLHRGRLAAAGGPTRTQISPGSMRSVRWSRA